MRLFIGYRTTPDIQSALAEARERAMGSLPPCGRLVPSDQWHLTVAFLGEVSDLALPHVTHALSSWIQKNGSPKCRITGLETFPHKHPRYQIAHIEIDQFEELARSVDTLRDIISVSTPTIDRKPWAPHIVLCKAKHGSMFPEASYHLAEPIEWSPTEISLVQSDLSPSGPTYTDLITFPLLS